MRLSSSPNAVNGPRRLTAFVPRNPAAAIAIAQSLRAQGVRAQVYGEQKKFKQKMTYANKLGVP